MENRKPQNVTWPRPCGHVCSLQLTIELQEGLPAVSDLRQGFFDTKNCTASRLKARTSFFISVCDVFGGFLISNQWIIPVFWAIKVMHFELMENNTAALNNERVVQIDFIFLSVLLT